MPVRGVDFVFVYLIFRIYFGTVLTVLYLFHFFFIRSTLKAFLTAFSGNSYTVSELTVNFEVGNTNHELPFLLLFSILHNLLCCNKS